MKKVEEAERPLRFAVFGPVRAWLGDEPLAPGPGRRRAVLAALLLHANRPVGREQLVEAVWGDTAPAYAVNQLQKYVSALRRTLEPGRAARAPSRVLEWSNSGYVLHVDREHGLDLAVFERKAARGREALARGDAREAAACLADALDLWTGPPLADVSSTYLDGERDRLEQLRTAVLEERIEADLRLGRHGRLIPELTRLTAEFPLRERFASLLMLALFRGGRQAEALAVYDTTRGVLAEELGVDPGPELRERHRQILADDPALALAPGEVRDPARPSDSPPAPAPRRRETSEELALRLDDARRTQIKAGDEARAAYALVFWLLEMVKSLQERVDRLEAERRPGLRHELAASRERLTTARAQLAQARRERERAEEIRLATRRVAEERLRAHAAADRPADDEDAPSRPDDARPDATPPGDERFTAAEDFGLAPLYEVDHVLEVSGERIREQADQLDKLSDGLRLPGRAAAESSATDASADGPRVVPGHLADQPPASIAAAAPSATPAATPSVPADAPAAPPPSKRLLGRVLLAGVTVLALLTPLSAYESRVSGLGYDMSSVPAKVVPGATGNASTPTYLFHDFAQLRGMTNTNDVWSTYVPRLAPPAVTFERRLRARIDLKPVRPISSECAHFPGSVAWTLTVNDVSSFASGTLSLAELDGDSEEIDSEIPEDGTITLSASGGGVCAFTLRLHRPSVHYRGLWAPG